MIEMLLLDGSFFDEAEAHFISVATSPELSTEQTIYHEWI